MIQDTPTDGAVAATRDPLVEAYTKHIDRSLLRRNLRLTPTQRLENLMALQRLAAEARRAGERLRRTG